TLLTLVGKAEPWPCGVWCSNPGVTFVPDGETKGQFLAKIAPDARPGPCLVRLHNPDGASEPRFLTIGTLKEVAEDEKADNDNPAGGQKLEGLPVTLNGRLEKSQDVDCYTVMLNAEQSFFVHCDSYALRAGTDPFLHLYGPDGSRLLLENDNPRNLDPRLRFKATQSGIHTLAIMAIASPPNANVSFHGAANAVYRLTLATNESALPARYSPEIPGEDTPEAPDSKPPLDVMGTLSKPGETDRHRFSATKGQTLRLRAEATTHGFPTDPVMNLRKSEDDSVIRSVDDGTRDQPAAEYVWKVPADGLYVAEIEDRFHRGGSDFRYRLTIAEPEPDFSATADKNAYVIDPGKAAEIKLKVTRENGHDAPLELKIDGLPEGVTAEPPEIPAKTADVTVKLSGAADARAASVPIRVRVVEKTGGEEPRNRVAAFSFQDSNARGPYLIDEIADLWLTVKAKPPDKKSKDEAKKE
ncbi:MAG: hypothetical protein KDM64_03000, partial [Verrucomicrobiae bacterium]|nr:hypothetical protein [Verrucomicrobiae bacterium]